MIHFTSRKEKRYWILVSIVIIAISFVLFLGRPVLDVLNNQTIQAVIFVTAMVFTGISIFTHGLPSNHLYMNITIWIGLSAVFILSFLRLGITERSHLIEYSILTLFVFMAMQERLKDKKNVLQIGGFSLLITIPLGIIDESIQFFLPSRVFDINDIIFNTLTSLFTIIGLLIMRRFKNKTQNSGKN
ncbi:MAG: VanZ family protein [Saprospiraceae bacterium]|nr:VanZ family protein [Saprospiraceae bacterium]